MSEGDLRLFRGDIPAGWLACEGQPLDRAEFPALFDIIGTTYGGDGTKGFNLPNLCGRTIVGAGGAGPKLGESGGERSVQLTANTIPAHDHDALCSNGPGTRTNPVDGVWAVSNSVNCYAPPIAAGSMGVQACGEAGEDRAHSNMQPYLALRWAIALR
jgi:microcystin-dependent protein